MMMMLMMMMMMAMMMMMMMIGGCATYSALQGLRYVVLTCFTNYFWVNHWYLALQFHILQAQEDMIHSIVQATRTRMILPTKK